jgi:hypothetical protein
MTYYDVQQQQAPWSNPLIGAMFNPQLAQPFGQPFGGPMMQGISTGLGQAAYGSPFGQFAYGQPPFMGQFGPAGWNQRQLSQHDVGEVVRQLLPILPQILAQAQQPLGYAAYGPQQRQLTPQDVNEVVRQLLPVVPQIVGMLQGQPQLQHAAMYGGLGGPTQFGQGFTPGIGPFGPSLANQQLGGPFPIGPSLLQQHSFGQPGWPHAQAAFGGSQGPWNIPWGQQRQLTQQDTAEIARQLVGLIPQVIGNLQAVNQQRVI